MTARQPRLLQWDGNKAVGPDGTRYHIFQCCPYDQAWYWEPAASHPDRERLRWNDSVPWDFYSNAREWERRTGRSFPDNKRGARLLCEADAQIRAGLV